MRNILLAGAALLCLCGAAHAQTYASDPYKSDADHFAALAKFDPTLKACSAKFAAQWKKGDGQGHMPITPCIINDVTPGTGAGISVCNSDDCYSTEAWIENHKPVAHASKSTDAADAEIISAYPGPLCNTVEPVVSHGRYVPVRDRVNGHEIFRIENGSKVAVCGAPVKGWYHISFGEDSTGWVRAEFVR